MYYLRMRFLSFHRHCSMVTICSDMNGCGASLIAPGVVLSAAHCAPSGFSFVGKSVIVGGYDRQQITNGALSVEVTATLLHPSYDDWTLQNDFM